ncbi:hypothetical protein TgHK011_003234 [Trichoderma gracile]|nr:hypothetical protein TgHK011_003234 [Trichoderma gracile]
MRASVTTHPVWLVHTVQLELDGWLGGHTARPVAPRPWHLPGGSWLFTPALRSPSTWKSDVHFAARRAGPSTKHAAICGNKAMVAAANPIRDTYMCTLAVSHSWWLIDTLGALSRGQQQSRPVWSESTRITARTVRSLTDEETVESPPIIVGQTHSHRPVRDTHTLVQGPVKGKTDARSKSAAVRQDSLGNAMERERVGSTQDPCKGKRLCLEAMGSR